MQNGEAVHPHTVVVVLAMSGLFGVCFVPITD
jgi:hypothetical protein